MNQNRQTIQRTSGAPNFVVKNYGHRPMKRKQIDLKDLAAKVCQVFGVDRCELLGRRKLQNISDARHAFCFMARRFSDQSYKAIGTYLGRDHSTVIHGEKQCEILSESIPNYWRKMVALERLCITEQILSERRKARQIERQKNGLVWG